VRGVRAAAIFGLSIKAGKLDPFRRVPSVDWIDGPPENTAQADVVVIFGGDGTVHRHLPLLLRLRLPVLIVPCGSGNDFARALGLRSVQESLQAWRDFASGRGNLRTIDLGVVTEPGTGAVHYFCGVASCGLDAEAAGRANNLPSWLRSKGGYVFAMLPALLGFTPFHAKVSKIVGGGQPAVASTPVMCTAFANSSTYGGGMKIAPRAQPDDGKLDVCVVGRMHLLRFLFVFPTVYFGRHIGLREIGYFQTEGLRLETEQPRDVYADGEHVCQTPIEVSLSRSALRVIVPA
jgi:diacylglycerol kinase (ATP)